MKKTLLLACTIISLSTISHAQIKKGSILLGGNIDLSKGKKDADYNANYNESSKSHTLRLNPTVGLAVKDNWVVGIIAGFGDYEAEPTMNYPYKQDEESYSAGVFVRRYAALGKNFYLYGNGSINYNQVNRTYTGSSSENYSHSKGVSLSVSPGITYTINKRFHLELALNDLLTAGYSTSYERNVINNNGFISSSSANGKGFNVGTNFSNSVPISIGFRFVLGK